MRMGGSIAVNPKATKEIVMPRRRKKVQKLNVLPPQLVDVEGFGRCYIVAITMSGDTLDLNLVLEEKYLEDRLQYG